MNITGRYPLSDLLDGIRVTGIRPHEVQAINIKSEREGHEGHEDERGDPFHRTLGCLRPIGGHMDLKVKTKEAITNPEQIAKIFQAIQRAENEIDKMKEKCWEEPSSPNVI